MFGHNLEAIKYPYLASIGSALELTAYVNVGRGAVYYAECDSTDGSDEIIRQHFKHQIADGELILLEHPWGTHHTIQAKICNFLLDQIGNKATFALKLDADEVTCEWSYPRFRLDLEQMQLIPRILGRPHYTHFLARDREFDFIYRSKAVISPTDLNSRFDLGVGGDACALGGAPEMQTHLEIHHYGKFNPGREREALLKERTFQQLYLELGFPDPKVEAQAEQGYLDYDRVFDEAIRRGEVRPYAGVHPRMVHSWLKLMDIRAHEFRKELANAKA